MIAPTRHLSFQLPNAVLTRFQNAVIYSQLTEGRFPRYQDVFPTTNAIKIPLEVGSLRVALEQASIVMSEDSRGVDFQFHSGMLRLTCQSADVGTSHVELPINYLGERVAITFDPKYLIDVLKTLGDTMSVIAELIDSKECCSLSNQRSVYLCRDAFNV